MKTSALIILAALLLAGTGCSREAAKRTSFETLQNLREQQCERDLSGHCPPRESYDAYQRKRNAASGDEGKDGSNATASPP